MGILGMNLVALSGLVVALTTSIIAAAMFILGKERSHFLWGVFCIAVCVWGGSFYVIGGTQDPEVARLWWKISHVGVIFIPVAFFHFVVEFIGRKERLTIWLLYVIAVLLSWFNVVTDLVIKDMRYAFGEFYYDSPPGILYPHLTIIFVALILYAHYLLYRAYKVSEDAVFRARTRYFFLATSIGFIGGGLSFLPVYEIDIYPITILFVAVAPPLIGFAILRYKLFDIKVVTAQFLTLILAVFSLFRLIVSKTQEEMVLNGLLLIVTLGVGVYLILSVRKEVEQRELIEEQKKELEKANEEKSEFMTFASHEIRNPLTAMRGYASLIVDGTMGPVSKEVKDAVQKIMVTGNEVIDLIAQFLNKSKMELGQLTYNIDTVDIGAVVHEIVDRFKPHAQQAGLFLKSDINLSENLVAAADAGKVKEVVGNIIDNSIKYTKTGGVTVSVTKQGNCVRVVMADTGAGIPAEVMPYLFQKFSRADAKKLNLFGTGLGLFLARTYMEAMSGKIWAESDGKDRGSRFIIELPLK